MHKCRSHEERRYFKKKKVRKLFPPWYYYYYYYYNSLKIFHSDCWFFFTGVWVIANLFKPPRTLLSILVVLNNTVVWMVSTRPFISKSSILWWLYQDTNQNWYKRHFHVPQFFHFPSNVWNIQYSFPFLMIFLCSQPEQQRPQFCKFSSFFVDYYKVWSSGQD